MRKIAPLGRFLPPTTFANADSAVERSALIALGVYLLGGIAYQRTVMHQRGWRQLPNYAAWAAAGSIVKVSLRRSLRFSVRSWRWAPLSLLLSRMAAAQAPGSHNV